MRAKAFGDILLQNLCFNEVYHLASSKITKKALANALKEVMVEKPFEKISVSDICNKCNRNRKSFYYHFKPSQWVISSAFRCSMGICEPSAMVRSMVEKGSAT